MSKRQAAAVWAAALMLGSAGCACVEEKSPIPCSTIADCAAHAPLCRAATACEQGVCAPFALVPAGTPIAAQTSGDCVEHVCDATGSVTLNPIDDPPDDGKACTFDICVGAMWAHPPRSEGITCYTGPEGTLGVGACRAGTRSCDEQGNPTGPCIDEWTPQKESCAGTVADEDCDGEVNEGGEGCACGDGYLSEGEECEDGNKESGDSCSLECKTESALPVAGGDQTCALLFDGNIKCWGDNAHGQLGLGDKLNRGDDPGEMGENLTALDIGGERAVAVAVGGSHTCALTSLGAVKCWGLNGNGQLGLGTTDATGDNPMEMGTKLSTVAQDASAVIAGNNHTCILFVDGSVKCWGQNTFGQLGQGNIHDQGDQAGEIEDLPPVDLGAGKKATALTGDADHTCAILNDGSLKCWGLNGSGALGLGDETSRGNSPGEMGDDLPAVNLGADRKAIAVATGNTHTCAILDDGSVKCWGNNSYSQLGLGKIEGQPDQHQGNAVGEMEKLPPVSLGAGKKATTITAGYIHTCVILDDGLVKCWGDNSYGQLGLDDTQPRGDDSSEMGDQLMAVHLGKDNLGKPRTATAITAGDYHTCAQLNDGSIKCWGRGGSGQLGLPKVESIGDAPGDMAKLPTVKLFSSVW